MKKNTDDDQKDLQNHGVKDIIPENEEYYTLDLTRGDDGDVDDIPEIDIADKDPAGDDLDEPLQSSSLYEGQVITKQHTKPTSSNDGGPVDADDAFDQNTTSGKPAGTAGHWGSDEDNA